MKYRKRITSKLFYGKWPYKIETICAGSYMIKRQGVAHTLQFCYDQKPLNNWHRHIDKANLLQFLNEVEPFLIRTDLQIRCEGGKFTIYCNDVALFNQLCNKLNHWISEIHEPASDLERNFIVDNDAKKVLCNEIPYGIFNYRVYIKSGTVLSTREKFHSWIQNYQGKIQAPNNVSKWLLSDRVWGASPFVYVSDKPTLSMVGLFLGNGVLRVEQFIPRNSINITINQEQTCQV